MDQSPDEALLEATRVWLRAADRLAAASGDATEDPDSYAVVLELAEEASLAKLRLHKALVQLGWSPPASLREAPRS